MAIKKRSIMAANDPQVSSVKFNFKEYKAENAPFHNDSTDIDFVTYNGSLYVCVNDSGTGVAYKSGNPVDNGFLLLVQKGADGRQGVDGKEGPMGPMPNYSLSFDGKQMVVIEQPSGTRKAVSPDLTGPVWVPELEGHKIVWSKYNSSDENIRPSDIDLDTLRPVEERPLLLRLNSDNTKRGDETFGPAKLIQWKHEGDQEWTNLMSISELMNIALAGVSFWQDPDDENAWHFGHREVLKASYSSDKGPTKKIEVELGDILFDAGKVPFPDMEITSLTMRLDEVQNGLDLINLLLPGLASKSEIPTDYVKSVRLNGTNYIPDSNTRIVDLGSFNTDNCVKSVTIDGDTKAPTNGNVTFSLGDKYNLFELRVNSNNVLQKRVDDGNWEDLGTFSSGSSSGLDDIDFQLNSNTNYLQYRTKENGSWGSWENIVEIPSGSGSGESDGTEYTSASYSNGQLTLIRRNNTNPTVLNISGGGSSTDDDPLIDVELNGNVLTFTTRDGDIIPITLPSSDSGSGSGSDSGCPECWTEEQIIDLIEDAIESMDFSGYYRKGELDDILNNLQQQVDTLSDDEYEAISFVTVSIYKRTDDLSTPTKHVSFVGDSIGLDAYGDVSETALAGKLSNNWTTSAGNGNNYLWVSYARVKIPDGVFVSDWSDPIRLTGSAGHDGEDGSDIEFVYCRTSGEQPGVSNTGRYYLDESAPTYTADTTDSTKDDFFPKVILTDNTVNTYWLDHPEGITSEWTHEWVAIRQKKRGGEWGNFHVSLWSRWGEDGIDGDGVEYVFMRTTSRNVSVTNNTVTLKSSITRPSANWAYDSPQSPWTDDPSGVSENYPYEFVCSRKSNNGVWVGSSWSEPALWAKFGENGENGEAGTDGVNVKVEPNNWMVAVDRSTNQIILDDELDSSITKTSDVTISYGIDWLKISTITTSELPNGITFSTTASNSNPTKNPTVTFTINSGTVLNSTVKITLTVTAKQAYNNIPENFIGTTIFEINPYKLSYDYADSVLDLTDTTNEFKIDSSGKPVFTWSEMVDSYFYFRVNRELVPRSNLAAVKFPQTENNGDMTTINWTDNSDNSKGLSGQVTIDGITYHVRGKYFENLYGYIILTMLSNNIPVSDTKQIVIRMTTVDGHAAEETCYAVPTTSNYTFKIKDAWTPFKQNVESIVFDDGYTYSRIEIEETGKNNSNTRYIPESFIDSNATFAVYKNTTDAGNLIVSYSLKDAIHYHQQETNYPDGPYNPPLSNDEWTIGYTPSGNPNYTSLMVTEIKPTDEHRKNAYDFKLNLRLATENNAGISAEGVEEFIWVLTNGNYSDTETTHVIFNGRNGTGSSSLNVSSSAVPSDDSGTVHGGTGLGITATFIDDSGETTADPTIDNVVLKNSNGDVIYDRSDANNNSLLTNVNLANGRFTATINNSVNIANGATLEITASKNGVTATGVSTLLPSTITTYYWFHTNYEIIPNGTTVVVKKTDAGHVCEWTSNLHNNAVLRSDPLTLVQPSHDSSKFLYKLYLLDASTNKPANLPTNKESSVSVSLDNVRMISAPQQKIVRTTDASSLTSVDVNSGDIVIKMSGNTISSISQVVLKTRSSGSSGDAKNHHFELDDDGSGGGTSLQPAQPEIEP